MEIPRPEYPRPQWVRSDWLNLNGEWEFDEDPQLSGEAKGWATGRNLPRRILVPFAPESRLSGLGNTDFMPAVWYRREFTVPDAWARKRIWLHFGAVDYEAAVWLNGTLVGSHRGGYTPLRCELTSHLRSGANELVVRAIDDTRSPLQPSGKQSPKFESYRVMYTRTTGIWQTVWLEATPAAFLDRAKLWPDLDGGRLQVQVWVDGPAAGLKVQAAARSESSEVAAAEASAAAGFTSLWLELPNPRAWSPSDPFLYDL